RHVHLLNVRMRPGRPLVCGRVAEVALIGLPGNPAAAYVSATQFVAPAIRHLLGHDHVLMSTVPARLVEPIDDRAGRTTFFRVRLDMDDQGYVATPIGPLNAADLAGLAAADGLLIVPEEIETVPADAVLPVQPISGM
ncbi:MAG: molybdopterin molybdenumtransferase MoeA, partial [Chloroflexota bacterium]|nr:molybdopterin molybdenumtransferase MoeA [Chloroflexota bacterium]